MAVLVSRDLSVTLTDVNADKMTERQQALRRSVQKGEPKATGISQVMIGVIVISYSAPLHGNKLTEVVTFGVPWWSGFSFILAGVAAIVLEKRASMRCLSVCLLVNAVTVLLSVLALLIYVVDLVKNGVVECHSDSSDHCEEKHYATSFSVGVKSCLLLFTLLQTAICFTLTFILFRERRVFGQYASLDQSGPASTSLVTASDFD